MVTADSPSCQYTEIRIIYRINQLPLALNQFVLLHTYIIHTIGNKLLTKTWRKYALISLLLMFYNGFEISMKFCVFYTHIEYFQKFLLPLFSVFFVHIKFSKGAQLCFHLRLEIYQYLINQMSSLKWQPPSSQVDVLVNPCRLWCGLLDMARTGRKWVWYSLPIWLSVTVVYSITHISSLLPSLHRTGHTLDARYVGEKVRSSIIHYSLVN